jgi:hypothetical protein
MVTRSSSEPERTAEIIPIGMATASHRTTAPSVRKIVAGRRSRICGSTSALFW